MSSTTPISVIFNLTERIELLLRVFLRGLCLGSFFLTHGMVAEGVAKPLGGAIHGNEVLVRMHTSSRTARSLTPSFPGAISARRLLSGTVANLNAAADQDQLRHELYLLQLRPGLDARSVAAELARRSDVVYAEPNLRIQLDTLTDGMSRKIPNDFDFSAQLSLQNTNYYFGKLGADIAVPQAWMFATGSRDVRVAVIDTGIDYLHPDLAANIWINRKEIPGNGLDDDGNGHVDDVHGYDFVSHDSDPMDDHFHGTHVSGIIGAVGNNGIGISGVCWEVSMMAVKAFDETGSGNVANAIEAIDYARKNGAQIINASWGLDEKSRALEDAIQEARAAGVIVVAAAGNSHTSNLRYPAALAGVIAVASVSPMNEKSFFSNFGTNVFVAAPGQDIFSTTLNGGYQSFSGTSMSTPHVSGVAALVLSLHPDFTRSDLENILRNSVDPVAPESGIGGRINTTLAVAAHPTAPPIPHLELPSPMVGSAIIHMGAAVSKPFQGVLEVGSGLNPNQWETLTNIGLTSVNLSHSVTVDSTRLMEGTNTFRLSLSAPLTNGLIQTVSTKATSTIANTTILSPQNSDILRHGEVIQILGTAFGAEARVTLEVGEGIVPTHWSTQGITFHPRGKEGWINAPLAQWDTSTLAADRYYSLRLTSFNSRVGTSQTNPVALLFLDSLLKKGWPQAVNVHGTVSDEDWRTLQVADLDSDGRKEIILVTNGSDQPPRLMVLQADGSQLWERELPPDGYGADTPVVGDLDGDKKPEIIVESGSSLFAFHGDGSSVAGSWPIRIELGRTGKVIAPLREDGTNFLITLSNMAANRQNQDVADVCVYNGAGQRLRSWEVPICFGTNNVMRQSPAVADLLPEIQGLEIIVPGGCGGLSCYNFDSSPNLVWNSLTPATFLISPVVGDLDGDGSLEIVIGSVKTDAPASGGLYVFDAQGKKWPFYPILRDESFETPLALGDVLGDGRLCIAAVGSASRRIHLIESDGFEVPGWPSERIENRSVRAGPTLVDVDGNSQPDILLPLLGYSNLALRENSEAYLGGIQAWNHEGIPIKLHSNSGSHLFPIESNTSGVYHKSSPIIATDMEGDGNLNLLAVSINDRTYASKPNESGLKQRCRIYAWQLSSTFSPANAPWPSLGNNPQMTGKAPASLVRPARPLPSMRRLGNEDTPLAIDIAGFIQGDITQAIAGDPGNLISIPSPTTVLFQPQTNFNGSENIHVDTLSPDGITHSMEIELLIQPRNDAPQGTPIHFTFNKNKPVTVFYAATDPDGDPLTYRITRAPFHGSVLNYPSIATYTPHFNFSGEDFLIYVANDGRIDSEPILVSFHVTATNNAPQVVNFTRTTATNQTTEIEFSGTDADANPLEFEILSQPTQGTLQLEGDVWHYKPFIGFSGKDSFNYRAFDGYSYSPSARVTLVVTTKNTSPTALSSDFNTSKNVPLILALKATDPESNPIRNVIQMEPIHGSISTNNQRWTYTPHLDFIGRDRFSFTAQDGSLTSAPVFATITVIQTNTAPLSIPATYTLTNALPYPIRLPVVDAEQTPLTATILKGPTHGQLFGTGLDWVYHPDPDYSGVDTFTFKAWDGQTYGDISTITIQRIDPSAPLPLAITTVHLQEAEKSLTMQITVPSLRLIRVEGSHDFETWLPLKEVVPTHVTFELTIPIPPEAPSFFRLVAP